MRRPDEGATWRALVFFCCACAAFIREKTEVLTQQQADCSVFMCTASCACADNKFSSFVRQLNFYGFRKVKSNITVEGQDSKWWEFKVRRVLSCFQNTHESCTQGEDAFVLPQLQFSVSQSSILSPQEHKMLI